MPATTQPAVRDGSMNETCDRCGPSVRATYRVDRIGKLFLCRHCLNDFWPALVTQGWAIRLLRPRPVTRSRLSIFWSR
jgi:ribosomal protein S14